jgi:hypothetical protein
MAARKHASIQTNVPPHHNLENSVLRRVSAMKPSPHDHFQRKPTNLPLGKQDLLPNLLIPERAPLPDPDGL